MKSLLGLSSFFGSGSCSVSCCFLLLFVTLRLFCSSLRRVSQMGRDGNGEHNDRFHSIHQYETDDLTGAVHNPRSCREWVVLFTLTLMLLISVRWRMELWR